nr:immunoglobulin light chain junction region [Macaca mulatta]MOY07854.1 immunoglobulin light chain junction region [Macaca mulatta]
DYYCMIWYSNGWLF